MQIFARSTVLARGISGGETPLSSKCEMLKELKEVLTGI